jgi:phosphoesterase RecJ-like protein
MVYRLAERLGARLTKAGAEALYVSIVADTGWFRYANTNAEVLRIAAHLIDLGADPWRTTQAMSESQPPERLVLLSQVLTTLQVSLGGKLATLEVSDEMIKRCGATAEMVEGFVGYARGIRGVEVGVLLSRKGQSVRASLRGRGRVDVARVAAQFGGGGHRDAAGCEIGAPDLAAARTLVEQAVERELTGALVQGGSG